MKTVTLEQILKWNPCSDYSERRLKKLAAGRTEISAQEILDLNIPVEDRLWAVLRNDFFTDSELRLLACDFTEHTLHIFERAHPGDARPRETIEVARRYAHGEATDEELAAARRAARLVAWDVARRVARRAAWGAAWGAARGVARRVARRAAEYAWQIEKVREYLVRQESVVEV